MKGRVSSKVTLIVVVVFVVLLLVVSCKSCLSLSDSVQRTQQQRVDTINMMY